MSRKLFVNLPERGRRAKVNEAESLMLRRLTAYLQVPSTAEALRMIIRESYKEHGLPWPVVAAEKEEANVAR